MEQVAAEVQPLLDAVPLGLCSSWNVPIIIIIIISYCSELFIELFLGAKIHMYVLISSSSGPMRIALYHSCTIHKETEAQGG